MLATTFLMTRSGLRAARRTQAISQHMMSTTAPEVSSNTLHLLSFIRV